MTGFSRASRESALGTLTWELRAVNHRYLDVQFKLPEELRPNEPLFRERVGDNLKRGKVECALHFRRAFDESHDMQIDAQLATLLKKRLDELSTLLGSSAAINPVDLLRWPGVIRQADIDAEPLFDEALALLGEALDALGAMRVREGERIETMLASRLDDIVRIAAGVRGRMPDVLDAARRKQRERIDKLDVAADPARLEVELALIAQKLDVDEELDRLDSHVAEIRGTLKKKEPIGRRLDFLMQELNREANTLGSKAADADTTKAAVDLKVLIEQMREQIQNVE
ncbi:MAG: YicC/YloC family endoribonuclease [Woeseiaceae bacterium]|nr:YicC/YloC family endoribonuclease [Woeseiaceae bacterium]